MKTKWIKAGGDLQLALFGAITRFQKGDGPISCPNCKEDELRFYYHEFAFAHRRTATVWIWCGRCSRWAHASRLQPPVDFVYADPFATISEDAFDNMERKDWIERLEKMWLNQEIPHRFVFVRTSK